MSNQPDPKSMFDRASGRAAGGEWRRVLNWPRQIARRLASARSTAEIRRQAHYVSDYHRLISNLLTRYPRDEAMARAVGGSYEHLGAVEYAVLRYVGLSDGMSLVDFGCGSGRLAAALGRAPIRIEYCCFDIDQRLLDYAQAKSPAHFRFGLNQALSLDLQDAAADIVCAFSVFTHLQHTETYLYLRDMHRVLRPGGRLVFSFLEFAEPAHWQIFADTVTEVGMGSLAHLNQFVERHAIQLWCAKLGYDPPEFYDSGEAPWGEPGPLGQALAILRRP